MLSRKKSIRWALCWSLAVAGLSCSQQHVCPPGASLQASSRPAAAGTGLPALPGPPTPVATANSPPVPAAYASLPPATARAAAPATPARYQEPEPEPVPPVRRQANVPDAPPNQAPPVQVPPPEAPAAPSVESPLAKLRALQRQAVERYATIPSYIVRLRRHEQINGKDKPEELLLMKFRQQPFSVYFKWLGTEGQGREVVYVKGQHGNQIHTLLAAGDMPLMPAGKRIALAPDNPFVRAASRHAITEAGIGRLIDHFGELLDSLDRGDQSHGTLKYLGPIKRPEYELPLETAEQTIPPGAEAPLPRGGRRWWLFDPVSHLPVLLITQNEAGHEVEYYCHDRFQYPVKLDDDDFNPDKLWAPKR